MAFAAMTSLLLALPSASYADVVKVHRQLTKLGLSIPGWFVDPNLPEREGDGRPTTPLAETVSSMLLLQIDKNGRPLSCEVLMTNGATAIADDLCQQSMKSMRFANIKKKSQKAFWVHAHELPATDEIKVTFADLPIKK